MVVESLTFAKMLVHFDFSVNMFYCKFYLSDFIANGIAGYPISSCLQVIFDACNANLLTYDFCFVKFSYIAFDTLWFLSLTLAGHQRPYGSTCIYHYEGRCCGKLNRRLCKLPWGTHPRISILRETEQGHWLFDLAGGYDAVHFLLTMN